MKREMELYVLDVDMSMSKRIEKYVDNDMDDSENHVHWSTYRHVEMMDKHIETNKI